MDSQDIVLWGTVRPEKWGVWAEQERIRGLCDWGLKYQLDGFVRMQMHLYVHRSCYSAYRSHSFPLKRGHDL